MHGAAFNQTGSMKPLDPMFLFSWKKPYVIFRNVQSNALILSFISFVIECGIQFKGDGIKFQNHHLVKGQLCKAG